MASLRRTRSGKFIACFRYGRTGVRSWNWRCRRRNRCAGGPRWRRSSEPSESISDTTGPCGPPGGGATTPGRAVAAYLARCCFGYPAVEVAQALGYRSPSSIPRDIARIESASPRLRQTVTKLERSLR